MQSSEARTSESPSSSANFPAAGGLLVFRSHKLFMEFFNRAQELEAARRVESREAMQKSISQQTSRLHQGVSRQCVAAHLYRPTRHRLLQHLSFFRMAASA